MRSTPPGSKEHAATLSRSPPWLHDTIKGLRATKYLQLLILPGLIFYIIFHYVPMYGVVIAFKQYNGRLGILGSPWIGFEHFVDFFNYPYFWRLLRNTFLLSFYSLLWGFPAPIVLAIILTEVRNSLYRRIVQTVSYLPHFLSVVIIVGMLTLFLSPSNGFINILLNRIFGIEPIYFLADPRWFRTVFVASNIWQNIGWGAIIYLAALSRVDAQLYEAATIDGASRVRQIWHISIPSIMPTMIILLILRMGGLLSVGFEKVLLMYNPAVYETADVISTFVYRRGLLHAEFSFGAAVGLFNSIINLILLLSANWVSRRVSETSLW